MSEGSSPREYEIHNAATQASLSFKDRLIRAAGNLNLNFFGEGQHLTGSAALAYGGLALAGGATGFFPAAAIASGTLGWLRGLGTEMSGGLRKASKSEKAWSVGIKAALPAALALAFSGIGGPIGAAAGWAAAGLVPASFLKSLFSKRLREV